MLEYSEYLEAKYSIVVHHQVPWSPKTNMIDLGEWMTVQSKVEKYHLRNVKQHDALAWYAKKSWHNMEEQKLTKIWYYFLKVPDLIIQKQSRNDLVEINGGLKGVPEENLEHDRSWDESNKEQ